MKEVVVLFVFMLNSSGGYNYIVKPHPDLLSCNESLARAQFILARDPDAVASWAKCRKLKLKDIQHVTQEDDI